MRWWRDTKTSKRLLLGYFCWLKLMLGMGCTPITNGCKGLGRGHIENVDGGCICYVRLSNSAGWAVNTTVLLKANANTEAIDNINYQTPLLLATKKGDKALVKLLLNTNTNIEARVYANSPTPLLLATIVRKQARNDIMWWDL